MPPQIDPTDIARLRGLSLATDNCLNELRDARAALDALGARLIVLRERIAELLHDVERRG